MKLSPYPKYKLSGVEWIGEVPEHWELKRLKTACHLTDRKIEADEEQTVPYIGMENIESWTGKLSLINDVVPTGSANEFKVGHTLFGKLRPYLAKVYNPDFDGLCSTEFLVLKGIDISCRALFYSLLSSGFIKLVASSAYGSKMPRTSWNFVGNCVLPIAPPDEQSAIADFLDRGMGKIDTLVAKKRMLIERLKEKRTALISRTVTCGLPPAAARQAGFDPHPELKPSGIDWLGEVPGHWETGNLRHFASMKTGHTPSRTEPSYWENCEIPWFTLADVWQLRDGKEIYLGNTKERISQLGLANSAAELLPAGTVIFSRTASIGFSGIMSEAMATSQDFWNWVPGPKLVSEYLLYQFRAMWQEFAKLTMGSTHKTIYQPDAARLCICAPTKSEQQAIADFLDRETAKCAAMIAKVETAIERLQEYRTALITAAVTGKIDVREAAA